MESLTCPVCGSGQVRSLAGGTRKRCRRCGYDSGIATAAERLPTCPNCNAPYLFLRFNGELVCRSCRSIFDKDLKPIDAPPKPEPKPVTREPINPDELTGMAKIDYLIRAAKAASPRQPLIKPIERYNKQTS